MEKYPKNRSKRDDVGLRISDFGENTLSCYYYQNESTLTQYPTISQDNRYLKNVKVLKGIQGAQWRDIAFMDAR